MSIVELEMVELVDDLLARLPGEELGMFDHRCIDFFETEAGRGLSKVVEEPVSTTHVVGIEVASAPRGLESLARVFLVLRLAHERVLLGGVRDFSSALPSQGIPRAGEDARVPTGIATNPPSSGP